MNMTERPADALLVIDRAMAMAPTYTGWSMMAACWAHLLLGQADKAIVTCERSAPLEPNWLVQLQRASPTPLRRKRKLVSPGRIP